jgi:glucosamine--fructose-6-phosphate aminotransferase (isomerizing)
VPVINNENEYYTIIALQLAARLKDKEHLFILGKGYSEPIALEGALKLKEMAYIHAEGYR